MSSCLPLRWPPLTRFSWIEAEALAYASANPGSLLLIDDRRGRRVAEQLGIVHRGTAGVLVQARRLGLFPELRPVLEALRTAGVHVAPAVVDRALREVGEA